MIDHDTLARLCRAKDRLREDPERALSIRDIAAEAGLSPYHFIRRFAAVFGETPHQLRIRARIEAAKRLLAATDLPITAVCLEAGFASLGRFSDAFARRVGVAPSAYRRRMRSAATTPGAVPAELIPGCLDLMCGAPPGIAIFGKCARPHLGTLGARVCTARPPCESSSRASSSTIRRRR